MTVQVKLDPAMEMQVAAETQARGISVDDYIREALLDKAQSKLRWTSRERKMSTEEFLDAMAYHGPIDPAMNHQKITREFIYGDL